MSMRLIVFSALLIFAVSPAIADSRAWPAAGRIYFSGQVKEGTIQIGKGDHVTLTQAIIMDGGFKVFADLAHVAIVRKNVGRISVDASGFLRTGHLEHDPELQADDIVVVPEKVPQQEKPVTAT